MTTNNLIVSVHDVTPRHKSELLEIVSELDRIGISRRSILVTPNWWDRYDLRKEDNFVAWLHELRDGGDEIVHHGYNHRSDKRKGHYKTIFEWFVGEVFAQGTGEFQNLTFQEARAKIEKGNRIFSDVGLTDIVGFVAPAWLVNGEVETALKDSGFKYHIYTNFWNRIVKLFVIPIKDLETGEEIKSRELSFGTTQRLVDYGARAAAYLLTRNRNIPSIRIAIHPQDIHHARPFDYALKLIEEVKEGRELYTYRDLVNG